MAGRRIGGFTLIELLIVVAIIGILAAIAVPNFLNAQVRAKVAHIQAELRSLVTAIESYNLDRNGYPLDYVTLAAPIWNHHAFDALTTPIAYLASVPVDDFFEATSAVDFAGQGLIGTVEAEHTYFYHSDGWIGAAVRVNRVDPSDFAGKWIAFSVGPDRVYSYGEWIFYRGDLSGGNPRVYASSNGTVSAGDIAAWGP